MPLTHQEILKLCASLERAGALAPGSTDRVSKTARNPVVGPSSLVTPVRGARVGGGGGYFTGVRPGTYAFPNSIQVDSKGRIVTIAGGIDPHTQYVPIDGSRAMTGGLEIEIDSAGVTLGAGNDMAVRYDGTDGIVETDLIAPSDLVIKCGAAKTARLETIVYEDMRVPGLSVTRGVSAPDLISFLGAGGLNVLGFDGGVTLEQVFFTLQFSHMRKIGTTIYPHVHWSPTTAAAGNVKWQLEYTWADIGETFGAATTISGTGDTGSTAWKHILTSMPPIDGSSHVGVSSMMVCRLFRDPTDDTYGADAAFNEFDAHFELDTMGSRQETVK